MNNPKAKLIVDPFQWHADKNLPLSPDISGADDEIVEDENNYLLDSVNRTVVPYAMYSYIRDAKSRCQSVFYTLFHDIGILHRLMTRAEYESYASLINLNGENRNLLVEAVTPCIVAVHYRCRIYGSVQALPAERLKAYTIDSICKRINEMSSFADPSKIEALQNDYSSRLKDGHIDLVLNWFIRKHIGNLDAKDLANMDITQYGDALGAIDHFSGGQTRLRMSPKE
jgi:hypothetical protein